MIESDLEVNNCPYCNTNEHLEMVFSTKIKKFRLSGMILCHNCGLQSRALIGNQRKATIRAWNDMVNVLKNSTFSKLEKKKQEKRYRLEYADGYYLRDSKDDKGIIDFDGDLNLKFIEAIVDAINAIVL